MTTERHCSLCGSPGVVVGECSLCEVQRTEGCGRKEPDELCCDCEWEANQS